MASGEDMTNTGETSRANNPIGMRVALMSETGKMKTIWLHGQPEGKYRFGSDEDGISEFFYIEAINGKWYVRCNEPAVFRDRSGKTSNEAELYDQRILSVDHLRVGCILYAEEMFSQSSSIFHNYQVKRDVDINIGKTDDNDIAYPTAYVGTHHASIRLDKNGWTVRDRDSVNGVFVNGKRVQKNDRGLKEASLKAGDTVDIMCARIIIGIGFISINVDQNRISVTSDKLKLVSSTDLMGFLDVPHNEKDSVSLFNRLPRRRIALEPATIEIQAPPMSLNSNNIPMLLRMGGPMVMSGASMLAGHFTMMITSVLFPVLTQRYTDKQRKDYEARRSTKYKEYLNTKSVEIQKELGQERSILCANYPELSTVLKYAEKSGKLWERRKTDDDFLSLRMGFGKLPLMAQMDYPPRDFDMDEDPLLEEMYTLVETPVYLERAPVMNSFVENFVCGVLGRRDIALSFIKSLIMQLAILHSYDEVKLIFLSGDRDMGELEFVRYLPHIWNDQKDFRFLATNAEEAYQISEYLSHEIGEDLEKQRELKQILKKRPYYFVIALDKRVFDSMEVLKDVMQADKNCGVSVLTVFDDLPKECIKIFDLKPSGEHSVVYLKQIDKDNDTFQSDNYETAAAVRSMRAISNINLKMVSQAYSLPKSISFLEMYEVGRVEKLDVWKRWEDHKNANNQSNSEKTLAVPVGVDTSGALFKLDLHEKFQGPHGLVAGMTGSGKSEFIISYILSMAVNYHPDDVAFVLIDYKGGGLAGAFEDKDRGIHLPHLVGTITNLDGSSIQRSLMSIQSELRRRQILFNEAKSAANEGTMDIYSYQKLYHKGLVSEALPHLFIISDEFAELKKQEPEFMDQLISAARIGRSLGVHLILATQKPSGVVDDQIWSNTKFRVCLRVQDRGDSFEMLKRPEAAELRDTGRFYLQVGYNEYFALGQSAYCGAPYDPQDEVVVQRDDEIQVVDSVGQHIDKIRPKSERVESDQRQIVAIVQHLSKIAEEHHIEPRPLWKEALRKHIPLKTLIKDQKITPAKYVEAVVGLVDDPGDQKQFSLRLNLFNSRNLLIAGESGSGKTTMLQTILYYVASNYTPQDVNFYILDFSSRNLGVFRDLPHCGAFLTDDDEDTLDRFFALLREIIDERRKLFAEAEVSSFEAYQEVRRIPLILLVVDNVARFEEFAHSRDRYEALADLMRGGVGYGIKTLFSISQINDCPMRLRREAGQKIALRARDRYAYTDILDCRCRYEPVDTPGRGICVVDDVCYEYQTALAMDAESEKERMTLLKTELAKIKEKYEKPDDLRQLDVVDEKQPYEDFCKLFDPERIPVGYDLMSAKKVSIPLQQLHCVSLYFGNGGGVTPIMRNLLRAARRENAEIIVIKRKQDSVFAEESELYTEFQEAGWLGDNDAVDLFNPDAVQSGGLEIQDCTIENVKNLLERLKKTVDDNKPFRDAYCDEHGITEKDKPEAVRAWRKAVRANSRPVMVFFESLLDVGTSVDIEIAATLSAFFQFGMGFNYYFWAGFYPDDEERLQKAKYPNGDSEDVLKAEDEDTKRKRNELTQAAEGVDNAFNPDKLALLFGGQFDKQKAVPLSYEWKQVKDPCSPHNVNKLLLCYHNKVKSLVMPCGDLTETVQDEDEREII